MNRMMTKVAHWLKVEGLENLRAEETNLYCSVLFCDCDLGGERVCSVAETECVFVFVEVEDAEFESFGGFEK